LGRFASCIAERRESGASCGYQAIFTGGECELGRAGAKDETAIEVTGDKSMVFKGDSESVSGRASDSGHSNKLCERVRP
jgi:hypothetical protein